MTGVGRTLLELFPDICLTTEEKHENPQARPMSMISVCTSKKITIFRYKDQLVKAVYGNNSCLNWESYKTNKYKMHSY
jgi:hypothetical protein